MSNELNRAQWLVSKYPFLRIKDNSVHRWLNTEEVEETWLDDLPEGWFNAFCIEMCDELLAALGDYVDDFIIIQVKEKYAQIRVYWYWRDREHMSEEQVELTNTVNEIIRKYSSISYHTCVRCGQEATKYSEPWILPFCYECFEEWENNR